MQRSGLSEYQRSRFSKGSESTRDRRDSRSSVSSHASISNTISMLMDEDTATSIFSRFANDMAIHLPIISIAPTTDPQEFRKAYPLLYLSILDAASSGFCTHDVQREVRVLLSQSYNYRMVRSDAFSIELLQALIISAAWHRRLENLHSPEQYA